VVRSKKNRDTRNNSRWDRSTRETKVKDDKVVKAVEEMK